jgi:hypothetical protein
MTEQDRIHLMRMCSTSKLPEKVVEFYEQFQRVYHTYGNGSLPESVLLVIAVLGGFGKLSEADEPKLDYDWEKVPQGADVKIFYGNSLQGGRGNVLCGSFMRVLHGDDFGLLEIGVDGSSEVTEKVDHRIVRYEPMLAAADEPVAVETTEDQTADFTATGTESQMSGPLDATISLGPIAPFVAGNVVEPEPVVTKTSTWDAIEIGTPVVVVPAEGGGLRPGKLHRVPSADGKHAGKLYIALDGDDKKYRMFDEEEVTVAVTQTTNA